VIIYLSEEQILFIHSRLIAETGGGHGVRDIGLLKSAITCPMATFDGVDLYSDLFLKTAALMASLAQNHPFVDGNKRIAITSASMFLLQNGRFLSTTNPEMVRFTHWVVEKRPSIDEIANWFQLNSKETKH